MYVCTLYDKDEHGLKFGQLRLKCHDCINHQELLGFVLRDEIGLIHVRVSS